MTICLIKRHWFFQCGSSCITTVSLASSNPSFKRGPHLAIRYGSSSPHYYGRPADVLRTRQREHHQSLSSRKCVILSRAHHAVIRTMLCMRRRRICSAALQGTDHPSSPGYPIVHRGRSFGFAETTSERFAVLIARLRMARRGSEYYRLDALTANKKNADQQHVEQQALQQLTYTKDVDA